jgi:hypothetical protein
VKDAGVALWRLAQEAGQGARYSRDEVVTMMDAGKLPGERRKNSLIHAHDPTPILPATTTVVTVGPAPSAVDREWLAL